MFYIRKKKKNIEKNEPIAHFRSFPLFWRAMWVNRSGCSEEMSDCEQIAQVAHQKWANEWIAHFFEWIAHSLIFGQKTSDSLGNQWANSQPCFLSKNSCKTKGRIRIFTCELDPYLRTGSFCWIRWGQSASVCQIRIHTIYPDLENVAGSGSGKVGTRSMQLRQPNSKTPFMHMLSNDGGTTKF